VRFCSVFERECRADLDAEVAGVEVNGGLFEDRPLALSFVGPTEDRRARLFDPARDTASDE
jgi:hypothetical protein